MKFKFETKKRLRSDISALQTIMEELQTRLRCSNLYLDVSIKGILLAIENAFKLTLMREPTMYNEALACLATNLVTDIRRIADIDPIALTNGKLFEAMGFDEATIASIEQQLPIYAVIARAIYGDKHKVTREDCRAFIEQLYMTENDEPTE